MHPEQVLGTDATTYGGCRLRRHLTLRENPQKEQISLNKLLTRWRFPTNDEGKLCKMVKKA